MIRSKKQLMDLEELNKNKCDICGDVASSVIRTFYTCGDCYMLILKDNILRFNKMEKIYKDKKINIPCGYYNCENRILGDIKYSKNKGTKILIKRYCSKECKIKDRTII